MLSSTEPFKPFFFFFVGSEIIHRADIRLSDISNRLHRDWVILAKHLNIGDASIKEIEEECPNNIPQQALLMLKLWLHLNPNENNGKSPLLII